MNFVLINQCSDKSVTPDILSKIAHAIEVQLNRDFSTYWGGGYSVRVDSQENIKLGECPAYIVDKLPDNSSAIAFHTITVGAVTPIYVARGMVQTLTEGSNSLSVAISHECLEDAGDRGCNEYCDDMTGTEHAKEMCDATENDFYEIEGVAVSNFLLPSFFLSPDAPGPYSYLGTVGKDPVPAAFQTAPGGYQILRDSGNNEHTQFASDQFRGYGRNGKTFATFHPNTPCWSVAKAAKRRHPTSRAYKRGVRFN